VLACGALHTFPDDNTAEIACLAVHPKYQFEGRGGKMLKHLEQKAFEAGLSNIFLLTTQTAHWFHEHGFKAIKLESLPVKKQALYNYKRNSKVYLKTLN
ncbi:MAG: GNAT family N-acetyltransferase, partial [Gammaproteobacteria bacterium]